MSPSPPTIESIDASARRIVARASQPGGSLDKGEFTMAIARAEITSDLRLKQGSLDGEWKSVVKKSVNDALADLAESNQEEEITVGSVGSSRKKSSRKSSTTNKEKSGSKRSRRSRKIESESESESGRGHLGNESFEMEQEEKEEAEVSEKRKNLGGEKGQGRSKRSSRKRKVVSDLDSEEDGSDDDDDDNQQPEQTNETINVDIDSDISSVIDEPPKRNARNSNGGKKDSSLSSRASKKRSRKDVDEKDGGRKSRSKGRKSGDKAHLDPAEERVAHLKKIVVACGVRKQWGKELVNCDGPKEEANHLLNLLKELGMSGKPSLSKARSLKQRRELAAELEDVMAFEAARGVSGDSRERSTKASRTQGKKSRSDPDEDNDEDEDDEDEKEGRNSSALDDVMAFFDNEDDEEEN